MALTHLKSTPVRTEGELPAVGPAAPFCSAEGIDAVTPASVFRSDFGTVYGVELAEGPMAGLLARAVVVIDPEGRVAHTELVDEITTEPDYQAALAAARG